MRSEGMTQRMRRRRLGDVGGGDSVLDGSLERLLVRVVPVLNVAVWVA